MTMACAVIVAVIFGLLALVIVLLTNELVAAVRRYDDLQRNHS